MTRTGGCLCGAVRYELDAEIDRLINCHCRFCRRAHGAAFVTEAIVPSAALRVTRGEAQIARHEGRFFCGVCASRLWNRAADRPEITVVIVTSLDVEPEIAPSLHLNVESKAPWHAILDDKPQFDGFGPAAADAD